MAARKGWEQLTPTYQKRLAGKGITAKSYASGVSLNAARGHATARSAAYVHPPKGVPPAEGSIGETDRQPRQQRGASSSREVVRGRRPRVVALSQPRGRRRRADIQREPTPR